MSAKATIFVLFAQALLIQSALSQVCGRSAFAAGLGSYGLGGSALTSPFGLNGLTSGLLGNDLPCNDLVSNSLAIDSVYTPAVEITPTTGGGLPVTSASPMVPNSLAVASENVYEGSLAVGGELPFVGTVGLEGVLPTAGSGAVNHACGNGVTRMVSQDGAAVNSGFSTVFAPSTAIAPSNIYNGIGAFGNAASVSPFGYGAGLGGLAYPVSGLKNANGFAGAYPSARFPGAYPAAGCSAGLAAYGGAGEGNVAVAGELPVAGNIAVAGEAPIMGAVSFGGNVPAAGGVTISGKCACGCSTPYAADGIGAYGAGVVPLSLLPGAGFNAPVAGIVAPIDGCYPPGIYY